MWLAAAACGMVSSGRRVAAVELSGPVGGPRELVELEVSVVVGVVGEDPPARAVVGRHGKREQALLAAVVAHQCGDVEELRDRGPRPQQLDPPGLLHHEQPVGVPGRSRHRHRLGEAAHGLCGEHVGARLNQAIDRPRQRDRIQVARAVLAEARHGAHVHAGVVLRARGAGPEEDEVAVELPEQIAAGKGGKVRDPARRSRRSPHRSCSDTRRRAAGSSRACSPTAPRCPRSSSSPGSRPSSRRAGGR